MKKSELIIAHHPMIFSKINKISSFDFSNQPIIRSIQNNIQVYSAHTNLDTTSGGIADKLADLLELKNIQPFETFARSGESEKEENLDDFLFSLKEKLKTNTLKVINPLLKTKIKKVMVCPGSGGDLIHKLQDIDLYLTADIRYHTALEVNNFVAVDAGHLETERIILPVLKELLQKFDIEIIIAEEKSPWEIK